MKTVFSILILFFSICAHGQKMASDYFEEASTYFEDEKFEEALKGYEYIIANHKRSEFYIEACYNVGNIYFIQKNYDKAIPIFKEIIVSNLHKKVKIDDFVITDPSSYRHSSSLMLSDIYYEKQLFDTALYYVVLSDTVYPYLHFCGNALAFNEIYTALRYADIYQKLKQPDKAIAKLLQTAFVTLEDNSAVIEELEKLLSGKKGLKKQLDESLNKIYAKKIKRGKYTVATYYLEFLDIEITISDTHIEKEEDPFDKDNAIQEIKQSSFYKMIETL